MNPVEDLEDLTSAYRDFAVRQAAGESPCFEAWAYGVLADPEVLDLIATLPHAKRQPNLVFAAARWHGAVSSSYAGLRSTLVTRWPAVRATILSRSTQTNEVGRCATLLPLLAQLPQPLALLEVGASAGLCLYPDRYSYRYSDGTSIDPVDGPSPVVLSCELDGPVPVPAGLPAVVWRAGIDLNPLDVNDQDAMAWLENLVWPEHADRRHRLAAAAVAATAPPEATLVVFHSAVLAYLPQAQRQSWQALAPTLPGHWISNEGPRVLPGLGATAGRSPGADPSADGAVLRRRLAGRRRDRLVGVGGDEQRAAADQKQEQRQDRQPVRPGHVDDDREDQRADPRRPALGELVDAEERCLPPGRNHQ